MRSRRFGRTGWQVGEIGYGMWGMGGDWKGSDDREAERSLDRAVELGVNFFDTAFAYGDGHSESLLGALLRRHPDQRLYLATKIPPKNRQWPSTRGEGIDEAFPPEYIREYTERSLANLGTDSIDLLQFHVWEDAWAGDERWQQETQRLKDEGVVQAWGVSINRWEPWNGIETVRTGMIDSVQVIYNIFDQNPEDELFPLCQELDVAIIARVPFDEGTLTGTLSKDSTWPEGDWRNTYFVPENLHSSVERADSLKPLLPNGMTMAEMALRFILANPSVGTIIPGMRRLHNVESNVATSDGAALAPELLAQLKGHRWERTPKSWSG
jgi:aryl-alcohol dehydrogenase-like predicted oxidoreductase